MTRYFIETKKDLSHRLQSGFMTASIDHTGAEPSDIRAPSNEISFISVEDDGKEIELQFQPPVEAPNFLWFI